MSGFMKIAAFVAARKARLAEVGVAYMIDRGIDWVFNYPLYTYVMWKFGLINGFYIMLTLSFLICLTYLVVYDIIKKDLFLIEAGKGLMERLGDYDGENAFLKFSSEVIKRGGLISAFLVLSLFKDPFYTVAFCRKGSFNGLTIRDWTIFAGSLVLGNASWALAIFGGIKAFQFLI
jgi:hypothetical protein